MFSEESKKILSYIKNEVESYYNANAEKINNAHGIDHTLRVVRNCYKIISREKQLGNFDDTETCALELIIAVFLHDLGRSEEDIGKHAERSYLLVKKQYIPDFNEKFVKNKSWDNLNIEKILFIIQKHSDINIQSKKFKYSWEILTDADKLDLFGAVGVLRSGAEKSDRFNTVEKQIEHIKDKLAGKYDLKTDSGKLLLCELGYKKLLLDFIDSYNIQNNIDLTFLD